MRFVLSRLALAAALVSLTGCMQIEYAISVAPDGSGAIRAVTDVDISRLAALESSFGEGGEEASATELCTEAFADVDDEGLPEGATIERINDGTRCAYIISAAWTSEQFASGSAELIDEDLTIESSPNGGWRFELAADSFTESTLGDSTGGAATEGGGLPDELLAMFLGDIEMTISIALPGTVVEHNGTEQDGTVSWTFALLEPPTEPLRARTEPPAPSSPFPSLPVVGGGVLAIAVGFTLWRRRTATRNPDIPRLNGFDGTGRAEPYEQRDPNEPTFQEGWYPDPYGAARLRWWDGSAWTPHTAE